MTRADIFKTIRDRDLPYFIFEIGGNFENLEGAKKLVKLAKECGADAVKLQHFKADTLTTRKAIFEMENTGTILQFDHFRKYELSEEVTRDIFQYAQKLDLTIFSTPSHSDDVDFLEGVHNCVYKIGSDDATNIPFLRYVASKDKPVILSTGMCTMSEARLAADAILEAGNHQLVLLHCTTQYPTHHDQVNLRAMQSMMSHFPNIPIGYSDHTIGTDVCFAAAVLGARVLEFHFTDNKQSAGPDHMLSKDPKEAAELVTRVQALKTFLGDGIKRPMPGELTSRKNNRKSIVLTENVRKGEKLTAKNIAIKRPGQGISAEYYYAVLGKTASNDLFADDILTWESFC